MAEWGGSKSTRGRTQRGRQQGTPLERPQGVNPGKTEQGVAEFAELMRELSPRDDQDGDASIPPANAPRNGTRGVKPQNLNARLRTTEQKILLTQSELDARVAAAVDARVAEAVAAALAEGSPATSQGAKLGPAARRLAAPPPAPILGLEAGGPTTRT